MLKLLSGLALAAVALSFSVHLAHAQSFREGTWAGPNQWGWTTKITIDKVGHQGIHAVISQWIPLSYGGVKSSSGGHTSYIGPDGTVWITTSAGNDYVNIHICGRNLCYGYHFKPFRRMSTDEASIPVKLPPVVLGRIVQNE
jgi:hypothetical protein